MPVVWLALGPDGARAQPAPARAIAIAPTPRGGPPFTSKKIASAIKLLQKAGVNGEQLSSKWADLESAPGHYDLSSVTAPLQVFGDGFGWTLAFTLQLIDTTVKQTPADLAGVAWDDPQMIARFHALIDAMAPSLNDAHLKYLSVGNEVDVYFENHPDEFAHYQAFYADALAYLHSVAPALKVGVTTTFTGTMGAAHAMVVQLVAPSDVIIFTYYPLQPNFDPFDPSAPLADFPAMVTFAGGKPVLLQEVGYPSAKKLGSSPKKQAAFVQNVFEAWDGAGDAIPFLGYFCLHDFGNKLSKTLAGYYGIPDPDGHFRAYVGTLGLRRVGGGAKPGWKVFVANVARENAP